MIREPLSLTSDPELVARYGASRAPGDFAEIVARHGTMVLRTCLRLTGNPSDAEDAAQATFLVLAQKAGSVRENLAGWLHKVARDCAQRVVRDRLRRARREEESLRMKTPVAGENIGELREEIDAALVRLPETLREAVVLRYLEGRDHEEAARLAGCNEATFRWRSMKGLQRLRSVLGRRGAVFTMSALVVFLTQEAAATAATAKLTAWAATAAAAAGVGAETGRAALVAKGIVNSMYWAKVKLYAATAAVTVAVAGAGVPLVVPDDKPAAATVTAAPANPIQLGVNGSLGGWRPFPDDNPWNQDISGEPRDPRSDELIAGIGRDKPIFPAFGPPPAGIPYIVVDSDQQPVPVRFQAARESDPGPYPIPDNQPLPAARLGRDDSPLLVLNRETRLLYEMNRPMRDATGWRAYSGAVFDLRANTQRPAGYTSADASGLPIFPGLLRYDEVVEQKAVNHALRFTCRRHRAAYVAPARHIGGSLNDAALPPLGMRVRLRGDYDVSGFSPEMQAVLTAMKRHGMLLAESGTDWFVSGTADPRWNDKDLKTLTRLKGKDFEVVRMGPVQTR